jgi:hypothetical protein
MNLWTLVASQTCLAQKLSPLLSSRSRAPGTAGRWGNQRRASCRTALGLQASSMLLCPRATPRRAAGAAIAPRHGCPILERPLWLLASRAAEDNPDLPRLDLH